MVASLWGEVFDKDTSAEVQSVLTKLRSPKKVEVSVEKLLKSKKTSLADKLVLIEENVLRILGVYKEQTVCIRTKQQLIDYIDAAIKNGIIAIDTETNNSLDPLTCKLMGGCIYTPGQKNAYIPIHHINPETEELLPDQLTEADIKEQFDRLGSTKVITHNGTFDFEVLKCTTGYEMDIYWDTMIGARMLDENERAGLKIQYVTKIDPSIEKYSIDHLFKDVSYGYVDPDIFALYAATDAYMTYKLYQYQVKQFEDPDLAKVFKMFMEVEMPLIPIIAKMELKGIYINQDYAGRLQEKYRKKSEEVEEAIAKEVEKYLPQIAQWRQTPEANAKPPKKTGEGLGKSKSELLENPPSTSSPAQLAILLYDVLKVPPVLKDTPRGTGEEALQAIDLPLCKLMLEKRGIDKLRSVFIDKLPADVNPVDKRLHVHYNQLGTACITGDTLIPTPQGYLTIKDIVEGQTSAVEEVQAAEAPLVNRYGDIETCNGVVKYLQRPIKIITLEGGIQIKGTLNHPVIKMKHSLESIRQNNQKQGFDYWEGMDFAKLENLAIGDCIAVPLNWNVDSHQVFPTNWTRRNLKHHISQGLSRSIPTQYNEELAELFGIYHADGICVESSNGSCRIGIHNKDEYVRARVRELSRSLFGYEPGEWTNSHQDNEVDTYININHINELREELPRGAHNKQIPWWVYKSSTSVINAYIRGLTLDSSLWKESATGGRYKIHVMKEQDARFIQQHLFSLGIESSIWKLKGKHASGGWCIQMGAYATKLFTEKIGWIAKKHLDRLPEVLSWKGVPKHPQKDSTTYRAIESIQESVADVFDVCMPQTHSFLGGCVINHNTGRFSSSSPNIQQIPSHNREIRMMFAPAPGHCFVGADFSQQEPRLMASISRDENMINAYKEGKDLYATVASIVHGNGYWDNMEHYEDGSPNPEGKKRRQDIKSIVLGLLYGRGAASVAEQIHSTAQEAQELLDKFFNGFPTIKDWIEGNKQFARERGYVEDLWGRRRRLPDIQMPKYVVSVEGEDTTSQALNFNPLLGSLGKVEKTKNPLIAEYEKLLTGCRSKKDSDAVIAKAKKDKIHIQNNSGFISQAERQCTNAKIQGSAATMSKRALIRLWSDPEMQRMQFMPLILVHDEIIGECPVEYADQVAERMSDIMKHAAEPECVVPFKVDSSVVVEGWYSEEYYDDLQKEFNDLCETLDEQEAITQILSNHTEILREDFDNHIKLPFQKELL